MANRDTDRLGQGTGQFDSGWAWKNSYVSGLGAGGDEYGLERYSQLSATPDSTLLLAGPARFTGATGPALLTPIGLVDSISVSQNAQLARLFEIGSNRSFFTRGKTICSLGLSQLLADTKSILNILTQNARAKLAASGLQPTAGGLGTLPGASADANVWLNLDSELLNTPFGVLMVFKCRGGDVATGGKILASVYLESCMFENFDFAVGSSAPVIQQNVGMSFDRVVPVQLK